MARCVAGNESDRRPLAVARGSGGPRYNPRVADIFITFEGIEGSGKSTQVALLVRFLTARGADVVTTREPGGTRLGERVRDILLDPISDPVPLSELFLLEAARAQLVMTVVAPALAAGRIVVSDRFADSSAAYQGSARALGADVVATLNRVACGGVGPTRTIVLDLPVEVALSRARTRPTTTADNSRFEDETIAFHRQVARGYYEVARREPGRVRLVDASGPPQQVHERVLRELADLLT